MGSKLTNMQAWDELEPAWREAFGLAWEAFGAGTIPVGAVVTAADGSILALGRNRIFADSAPAGQLFGTRLAHAEINALAQLPAERRYADCTLWTTLEPCAQCIGAAWIGTIGRLVYAAADFYGGSARMIERELEAADNARTFPLAVEGPLDSPLAVFSEVIWIDWFLRTFPVLHVTDAMRDRRPELVALAEGLRLRDHASAPLDEVLTLVLPEL